MRVASRQTTVAGMAVAAITGHNASDHGGGVFPGRREQGGDHGAGGGFAVAAGDGDRGLLGDQGCQHIRSVQHGQPLITGCFQFGVVVRNGGAHHHLRRCCPVGDEGGDGGGQLFGEHLHTQVTQLLDDRG